MKSRLSSVLVAAAIGMAGAASPVMQNSVPAITRQASKRQIARQARGWMLYGTRTSRRTVAQDKREARKARNRKRQR